MMLCRNGKKVLPFPIERGLTRMTDNQQQPYGSDSVPQPAQPAPRGIGESLFRAAGDLLGQLAEEGPMSQEEFEALRQNLSRKRKRRKKQGVSR